MPVLISFILTTVLFLQTTDVFAAAAVARRQQMQHAAQQQAQQVQQAQEQAMVAQYQAAQQQAYAQQVQQYQEQMMIQQMRQQQEQAYAQQIVIQIQAQKQAYVNAVNVRKRQVMDAQQQAMIAAQAQAIQKAAVEEAVRQKIVLDAVKMAQIQQLSQAQAEQAAIEAIQTKRQYEAVTVGRALSRERPYERVEANDIKDIVDISDVWRKLDVNSRPWTLMIDNQAKVATVSEYIDRYGKQGVRIQGAPIEYVHMIDDMAIQNPSLLNSSFKDLLQLVAIMQYDFDNGIDKDSLAKKILGEQLYSVNKKRMGR